MNIFNDNAAYQLAKDFTEKAIENGLIKLTASSEETAQNVIDFFVKIYESLIAE